VCATSTPTSLPVAHTRDPRKGHSSTKATDIYIHADMTLKEKALARVAPTPAARRRYRPPDKLLAFLEGL
jgi:integrase/recombinase XerD